MHLLLGKKKKSRTEQAEEVEGRVADMLAERKTLTTKTTTPPPGKTPLPMPLDHPETNQDYPWSRGRSETDTSTNVPLIGKATGGGVATQVRMVACRTTTGTTLAVPKVKRKVWSRPQGTGEKVRVGDQK